MRSAESHFQQSPSAPIFACVSVNEATGTIKFMPLNTHHVWHSKTWYPRIVALECVCVLNELEYAAVIMYLPNHTWEALYAIQYNKELGLGILTPYNGRMDVLPTVIVDEMSRFLKGSYSEIRAEHLSFQHVYLNVKVIES